MNNVFQVRVTRGTSISPPNANPIRSDPQCGQSRTISAMSNLSPHLKEIGKTLAPEYGPESPNEAVERLFRYYRRAGDQGKHAFVAALIAECVALKAMLRSPKEIEIVAAEEGAG